MYVMCVVSVGLADGVAVFTVAAPGTVVRAAAAAPGDGRGLLQEVPDARRRRRRQGRAGAGQQSGGAGADC